MWAMHIVMHINSQYYCSYCMSMNWESSRTCWPIRRLIFTVDSFSLENSAFRSRYSTSIFSSHRNLLSTWWICRKRIIYARKINGAYRHDFKHRSTLVQNDPLSDSAHCILLLFPHRLIKIKEWVDKNDAGAVLIPFSGIVENKLLDMDEAERSKYFEEHKVTRSAISFSTSSVTAIITFTLLRKVFAVAVALANERVQLRVVRRRFKLRSSVVRALSRSLSLSPILVYTRRSLPTTKRREIAGGWGKKERS